jgi:hypothetical protein
MGKKKGRVLEKLGEFHGKLGERFLRGYPGFSGVSVIFCTTVMARRTGQQGRGGAGFPSWWPTAALGRHAWVMARVRAVPAGFAARAPRGKESTGVSKGGK